MTPCLQFVTPCLQFVTPCLQFVTPCLQFVTRLLTITFLSAVAKGVVNSIRTSCQCHYNPSGFLPAPRNVMALSWKNVVRIYRNPGLLLFQFVLPTLQVALFCLAVGNNLTGVKTAVVNLDMGLNASGNPFLYPVHLHDICTDTEDDGGFLHVDDLGELYVNKLRKDPTFDLVSGQ